MTLLDVLSFNSIRNYISHVTPIGDAILKTVAYFDVFDYPLTGVEAHKFLWRQRATLGEVLETLAALEKDGRMGRRLGYYFLPGREALVATRQQRYLLADTKYRQALRAARLLRLVPNIRLVAVCNNLAFSNARSESDIDLFIVTAHGRIWLTRLLVVIILQAFGLRHHGRRVTDRCCLSFFVADDRLDLRDIALTPEDPYLCYWLATLTPIYTQGESWHRLWEANHWVFQYLPNDRPKLPSVRRRLPVRPSFMKVLPFGAWLETWVKRPQLARMARLGLQPRGTAVVISDSMLKFHTVDRREQYRQEWQRRVGKFPNAT